VEVCVHCGVQSNVFSIIRDKIFVRNQKRVVGEGGNNTAEIEVKEQNHQEKKEECHQF
jgi:hypothetical protein